MVLEVTDKSQEGVLVQYAIRASIPPGPLSTEIQKVQRGWYKAGKKTTPKDLYASIPIIHPKLHIIPGLPIPAVGRFPIQLAESEGWPEIGGKTWYMMAMTIASQTRYQQQFPRVFALCNQKLQTYPAAPAQYAATYLHHPDEEVQDPRTTARFHVVPPPPPRPSQAPRLHEVPPPPPPGPPPPRFSLMTRDGAIAFTPDYVVQLNPEDVVWEC